MQASYVKLPTCGIGVGEEGVADGGVCCIDGEEGVSDEVSEPAADPAGHEPDQRAPREPSRAGLQVWKRSQCYNKLGRDSQEKKLIEKIIEKLIEKFLKICYTGKMKKLE